ncbi:class I SAM-dependent methyltransferase [Hydrogenophaga sp.]|uniref:class I SAM-dependent methyltransferase n=1 Tax=Hydrogenophaga sp. TaxID=1904254 RepID=UPI0027185407|nr:methyltransferase domain-containing protein [Hydrogenophaga sp.]MDO8904593.1 methyltransferase domain-containing protein [Hydrogenophaga sp.]
MSSQIIGLQEWFQTPPGQYLLEWERAQFDLAVADLFGYNALQLGLPELWALKANRMPHRWLALPEEAVEPEGPLLQRAGGAVPPATAASVDASTPKVALVTDSAALPFPPGSLDLVVLPHTLELSADPHHVLREVERVLVPEGRVVISGLNPASLWGLRQGRAHMAGRMGMSALGASKLYLPEVGDFIGPWRLRDWLRLLSFEVESDRYGCYRPAVRTEKWLQRNAWLDRAGAKWWPVFGAVYFVVAVKRVRGMRLLGPAWKPRRAPSSAPVPAVNRH